MKKLYLLILRSFFGPFLLIFFIVLFVLLIQFLWRYIDELVGKGLDTQTIGQLLMYTSASLVPMALPLSILMSSLMTFGNLGERYELTAIKASGISLQKIMRPLILVVFLISVGAFFFANNVLPYANLQMRSLLYDIRQQRPELQIQPGVFNNLIDGYSIRVGQKNPKTNMLYNVTIYDHSDGKGNTSVVLADSGTMVVTENDKYFVVTLFDGKSYNELFDPKTPRKKRSYPHRFDRFKQEQIVIELTGFGLQRTDQSLFKSHYSMLNLSQLELMQDSLGTEISEKENFMLKSLKNSNYFKSNDVRRSRNPQKQPRNKTNAEIIRESKERIKNNEIGKKINTTTQEEVDLIDEPVAEITDNDDSIYSNDSTITTVNKKSEPINLDSLISCLTLSENDRISNSALTMARTAKNLVENAKQSLEFKTEQLRRYEIEWHRKFTISFACLLFMFIGAPLGAIIRKGGLGLPLVISVIFFILYYILSLTGEKLVRTSVITGIEGMWGTSLLFSIIGAFITYKATTDSSLFNMDTYSNFIKKLFGQRFNIVDVINIDKETEKTTVNTAKTDNINSSLYTLNDNVDRLLEANTFSLAATDFLVSMYSIQSDSDLVIFEKFYVNTFKAIVNHPVFHNKNVRAKTYEFPALKVKEFQDPKAVQVLLVIFACIPPFTLIVALRHYIKLIVFRSKLKQIKRLIPEMGSLLKIHQ